MAAKITNGQGLIPITGNGVKAECDYKFDLINLRTNNANFSSFYKSSMPAVQAIKKKKAVMLHLCQLLWAFVAQPEN